MKKSKEYYMKEALEEAKKAYSISEVPIGAIVVYQDEIVGRGHNERESNSLIYSHAEINALVEASKILKSWKMDDCEIYVTIEPCPMCAYAIIDSHIKSLYFGAYDPKRGAISTLDIFNKHLGTKVEVYDKILEEECSSLISRFFKELRTK